MIEGGAVDGPVTSAGKALRKKNIETCIENLEHSCSCKETDCPLSTCEKMRRVVNHYRVCKQKEVGSCDVCKQLLALCATTPSSARPPSARCPSATASASTCRGGGFRKMQA